jgi:hypothetical protein
MQPAVREYACLIHSRSDTIREDAMIPATARIYGLTEPRVMNAIFET